MGKNYNLFLDDDRLPYIVGDYCTVDIAPMYRKEQWIVVKDYNKFVVMINQHGLPDIISFDHDLADEHYLLANAQYTDWMAYYNDNTVPREMTGYDCAKWLIDYVMNNNLELPKIFVHSQNQVGKENIEKLFENYRKWQKNQQNKS